MPFVISNSETATIESAFEDEYKVGLSMSGTVGFLDLARATLKDTATWQWTNKSSRSSATGTSQSASVTIGGPAYGYLGGTVMQVYFDTVYKTFAFAIVPIGGAKVGVDGTLVSASGRPLATTEVTLVANGVKQRTFTNAKGEFRFFGDITGSAIVHAAGTAQVVSRAQSANRHVELRKQ